MRALLCCARHSPQTKFDALRAAVSPHITALAALARDASVEAAIPFGGFDTSAAPSKDAKSLCEACVSVCLYAAAPPAHAASSALPLVQRHGVHSPPTPLHLDHLAFATGLPAARGAPLRRGRHPRLCAVPHATLQVVRQVERRPCRAAGVLRLHACLPRRRWPRRRGLLGRLR